MICSRYSCCVCLMLGFFFTFFNSYKNRRYSMTFISRYSGGCSGRLADFRLCFERLGQDVHPVNDHFSVAGRKVSGQNIHRGTFARSVDSKNPTASPCLMEKLMPSIACFDHSAYSGWLLQASHHLLLSCLSTFLLVYRICLFRVLKIYGYFLKFLSGFCPSVKVG